MPRTLSALLLTVLIGPVALAKPPEGPSGRMVLDEVTQLRAEVQRLEKEAGHDQPRLSDDDQLAVARARLAAAEGRIEAARAAWSKIIAVREERMRRWESLVARGLVCEDPTVHSGMLRGHVALARCGMAEVGGDRAVLARELPKVIASYEARLRALDGLRGSGACRPEDLLEGEKAIRKELRKARVRLDGIQRMK